MRSSGETSRSVLAIGMSLAALLVLGGLLLLMITGTSVGVALMILGFLAVVLTAVLTALD